jgi:hypothetical protein
MRPQLISNRPATPMPPPTHMVTLLLGGSLWDDHTGIFVASEANPRFSSASFASSGAG